MMVHQAYPNDAESLEINETPIYLNWLMCKASGELVIVCDEGIASRKWPATMLGAPQEMQCLTMQELEGMC